MLSILPEPPPTGVPSVLVCGPKGAGKSTFVRLLANRLLSDSRSKAGAKASEYADIMLLDLDPGQPEFSPPGQLSLVHLQRPILGPPFSHPDSRGKGIRVMKAHSIAALSPAADPSHYMACALDLILHYDRGLPVSQRFPLIVNTPGWILGTGLEILINLVRGVHLTGVVYMSQDGPWDVTSSLKQASTAVDTQFYTLPSQISEYHTRTSAHLRTMQAMSYFHLDTTDTDQFAWNACPLTAVPPWELKYAGKGAGIAGIMCLGEQPSPDLLKDTIDGSILAVVIVDDRAALPGWQDKAQSEDTVEADPAEEVLPAYHSSDAAQSSVETFALDSAHTACLEKPVIITTPERLPYFNPANAINIDPRLSRTVGLALVRGIDTKRHRLQILTPISAHIFHEAKQAGKDIVLVSGKLDTPGWAYIEDLSRQAAMDKRARKQKALPATQKFVDDEADEDEDMAFELAGDGATLEGFDEAPWVEALQGDQGRGVGAKVWRVRRDLGRGGGDGDD